MNPIESAKAAAEEATEGTKTEALEVSALAGVYLVETEDQATNAIEFVRDVKAKIKALEAKRDAITGPLKKALAETKALFDPTLKALDLAEKDLKAAVVSWGADRISDADTLIARTRELEASPAGLYTGAAGVGSALLEAGRLTGEERYRAGAVEVLEHLHATAFTQRPSPLPTVSREIDGEQYEIVADGMDQLVRERGIRRKRKIETAESHVTVTTTPADIVVR